MRYELEIDNQNPADERAFIHRVCMIYLGSVNGVGVAAGLTVLILLMGLTISDPVTRLVFLVPALFGGPFYLLFTWWTMRVQLRRTLKLLDSGAATIQVSLTDNRVETETPKTRTSLDWSMIRRLHRFPEIWLFQLGLRQYFGLPTNVLTPDVRAFIEDRVRNAGGKVL